jgi:hypothetical protein
MTQLYPQPAGFNFQNSGPAYVMFADSDETATIYATATGAIAVNDVLTFSGEVVVFDGEEIEVKHNVTHVGWISEAGPFSFNHTATHTSPSLRFLSGGEPGDGAKHVIRAPSVTK